ncbi:DUF6612 family protein [Halobacterium zhouii]|uniref:DUF6612 family protein n=1 Tax=Halobacterium zhouii TaxID=2902624 RepID=UPI001E297A22|nr:DUF6612 family protein [Halobacterium zhouii]
MKRTLLTLCVAALLVTAGCSSLTGDGAGEANAEQYKSDTIAAIQSADTYRMAMDMNISANGQSFSMSQGGVFNHETKKARLSVTAFGVQGVTYMDGSTIYVKMNDQWRTKESTDQDPWKAGNGVTQHMQVLESGEVSISGTATVDGVETTVLSVDTNESELMEILAQQGQNYGDITIEDATYKLHVADDTHRPRKAEMTMTMNSGGQTAVANVTVTFSEYGEPVDITIPDAATKSE